METKSFNHIITTVAKLYEKGLYKQAVELLVELCNNYPDNDDLFFKLGFLYSKIGDYQNSIYAYDKAIQLNPNKFEYFYNCAIVLTLNNNIDKAIEYFNNALRFKPNDVNTLYNLGCALKKGNYYNNALDYFNKVLNLNPDYVDAIYNIGVIYYELQDYSQAKNYFQKTIEIKNDFADAYWNLALIYLREGNYFKGFEYYYWRWKTNEFIDKRKSYKIPLTDFTQIENIPEQSRVLISTEQGYGDTIQFIRFITHFKQKYNVKITFQTKQELYKLLKSFKDIDELYTFGQFIEKPDFHFTVMDIPTILKISTNDIDYHFPYLAPTSNIELSKDYPINIGFCIKGSPYHKLNHLRNIDIEEFKSLFDNQTICFWNLGTEKFNINLPNYRELNFNDFDELASIMQKMDLIISVDTAVIHLAGALNLPAILLLPEFTDWRWELDKDKTPFYPSIKIFRKNTSWQNLLCNDVQFYLTSLFENKIQNAIVTVTTSQEITDNTSTASEKEIIGDNHQINETLENIEFPENKITEAETETLKITENISENEKAIQNTNNSDTTVYFKFDNSFDTTQENPIDEITQEQANTIQDYSQETVLEQSSEELKDINQIQTDNLSNNINSNALPFEDNPQQGNNSSLNESKVNEIIEHLPIEVNITYKEFNQQDFDQNFNISEPTDDKSIIDNNQETISNQQPLINKDNYDIIYQDLDKAIMLCNKSDYISALKLLDNHIKNNITLPELYYNYALILLNLNNLTEAEKYLEKASEISSNNPNIILTLAKVYIKNNQNNKLYNLLTIIRELEESYEKYFTLGVIHLHFKDYYVAKNYFDFAIKYQPNNEDLLINTGYVLFNLKDFLNATNYWTKVLEINPNNKFAYFNLGKFFEETKSYKNALECYLKAIEIDPNYYDAQFSAAEMYLMLQDFNTGWAKYEYRKYLDKYPKYQFNGKEWKGEDIGSKILLVYDEQGLGDSLQFVRYIKRLHRNNLIFAVRDNLINLYKHTFENIKIISLNKVDNISYDYYISLLSLPKILNIIPDNNDVPYLKVDFSREKKFLPYLVDNKLNIFFAPKASGEIPDKDLDNSTINNILSNIDANILTYQLNNQTDKIIDLTNHIEDITDTLALISKIDLVITVDTAVAHLAGAIGKSTILLLKYNADWRWFEDLNYSIFYPNFKILRQKEYCNWSTILNDLLSEITNYTKLKYLSITNYNSFVQSIDENIENSKILYKNYSIFWFNDINKYPALIAFLEKIHNPKLSNKLLEELKILFPDSKEIKFLEALKSEISNSQDNAIENYYMLLEQEPDNILYKQNIANLLLENGNVEKAKQLFEEILAVEPSNFMVLNNLANIYQNETQYSKAEILYKNALSIAPINIDILYNYASLLQIIGNQSDAINYFRQILRLDFNNYRAHFNLSTILLSQGNFVEGYNEYEYRRILPEFKYKNYNDIPYWNGENLTDKKLLILAEQGYGDVINFLRFIKYIKEKYNNVKISFQTKKPLIPLLEKLEYIDEIIPIDIEIEFTKYDYYIYYLSILKHFIDKIYTCKRDDTLQIEPKEISLPNGNSKKKIGICWRGSQNHKHTKIRDLSINEFLFLTSKSNYQIYSFQLDTDENEEKILADNGIVSLKPYINDFYDSYSFLKKMDIVITVDTAILHLAASTNHPKVYAYIPFFNDWRWLNGNNPNLWYNNLILIKNVDFNSAKFLENNLSQII